MVKPFEMSEVVRRIRAIVRRTRGSAGDGQLHGPQGIVLRPRSHAVFVEGQEGVLTPKEFAVLRVMLEHRGEVVSTEDLSVSIWGYQTFGSRNFVEAHVSRLRSKLATAGAPGAVTTLRGVGCVIR